VSRRASQNKTPEKRIEIPSFTPDQVQSLTYRYVPVNSASGLTAVTLELPIPPFGSSASTTVINLPFKAIRLARIRLWANFDPDVSMDDNTISIICKDRRTVRPIEWSDTATYSRPAYLEKHFSKFDPLGLWYITTSGETNPELTFVLPKKSLLELTFSYILADESPNPTFVGSGLNHPRVYSNSLDANLFVVGKASSSQTPMTM
jgi:hypothetical protein